MNTTAKRYVIIHGHFYQPPRENPWLDLIERQQSAAPYHDWNEAVYDQCYRPNAFSRLLDPNGMIIGINNNYRDLSFNFGPTLFLWLEREHPRIAGRIVEADRESLQRHSNHGNALGQVYNHIIMPLASRRDQLTQIRWARAFFRKRFGREPEGLWLAETAINMETVRCLVEEGIRFVILSSSQAEAFRPLEGAQAWQDIARHPLDTRRPYRVFPQGPGGGRMDGYLDVFFFNEQLSREVSFGDVLADAHRLGSKIGACFDGASGDEQAVIIATDGETFGHHKPLSDMCLSYFFCKVAGEMDITPVNFGRFLEIRPPRHEVMLKNANGEGTSWSCEHGTGRWIRDCGCKTGGRPGWKQEWRGPLRSAFEGLQKKVDGAYEKTLAPLFSDPWKVRDAYCAIEDARSIDEMKRSVEAQGARRILTMEEALAVRRLLEAQKFMLFAFTSCGWFFADVGGIETIQNIAYAARALQLGIGSAEAEEVRNGFLAMLDYAKSNIPRVTGRTLYADTLARTTRHLEIIAFTAVAGRAILGNEENRVSVVDYHGYALTLSQPAALRRPREAGYSVYGVELRHKSFFEQAELAVLLHQNNEAECSGWVLPAAVVRDASFDGRDPARWIEHESAVALDLASIFAESKILLERHFLDQLSRDTHNKYLAWLDRNERIIASLCSLDYTIPAYVAAPIAFVLSEEWNAAISGLEQYGGEEAVLDRLESLRKKALKYAVAIDFTVTTRLMEAMLSAEMTLFTTTLSFGTCRRMSRLLDIVDRFGIPVAKSKIEDAFYSVLMGAVRTLYDEYQRRTAPAPAQRENLSGLLEFARRLNFNTNEFPLEAPAAQGG